MNNLTFEDGSKIASLQLENLALRLSDKGILVTWDNDVPLFIAKIGMDSMSGARNIKRAVIEKIATPLSEKVLTSTEQNYHLHIQDNAILVEEVSLVRETRERIKMVEERV